MLRALLAYLVSPQKLENTSLSALVFLTSFFTKGRGSFIQQDLTQQDFTQLIVLLVTPVIQSCSLTIILLISPFCWPISLLTVETTQNYFHSPLQHRHDCSSSHIYARLRGLHTTAIVSQTISCLMHQRMLNSIHDSHISDSSSTSHGKF